MALTLFLHKRHRIEYDSDVEELERMMVAVGGGSILEKEGGAGQEAPPSVIGQTESHDLTSEIKVLGETVPPEDTSESCPRLALLRVTRVGKVGATVGNSELASLYLMTTLEPQKASSWLSLLLRRGDNEVTLGHATSSKEWRSSRHSHRGSSTER